MVNDHGDRKSPKDRVVPFPNGRNLWLISGGRPNYLLYKWGDPPSGDPGNWTFQGVPNGLEEGCQLTIP